ncbi:hypothetical protein ACVKXF_002955 [Curtobacterium sp. PvP017]
MHDVDVRDRLSPSVIGRQVGGDELQPVVGGQAGFGEDRTDRGFTLEGPDRGADAVPGVEQLQDQVAGDEAGAAGDQDVFGVLYASSIVSGSDADQCLGVPGSPRPRLTEFVGQKSVAGGVASGSADGSVTSTPGQPGPCGTSVWFWYAVAAPRARTSAASFIS